MLIRKVNTVAYNVKTTATVLVEHENVIDQTQLYGIDPQQFLHDLLEYRDPIFDILDSRPAKIKSISLVAKDGENERVFCNLSYVGTPGGNKAVIVDDLYGHRYIYLHGDESKEELIFDPKSGVEAYTCWNPLIPEELEQGYLGLRKDMF